MSEEYPDDCLKREKRLSLKKTLHCETMREGEERERERRERVEFGLAKSGFEKNFSTGWVPAMGSSYLRLEH